MLGPPSAVVIGRAEDCGIVLNDERRLAAPRAPSSPRRPGCAVVDLGSANGVLVDGQRVGDARAGPRRPLPVGGTVFELSCPARPAPPAPQPARLLAPRPRPLEANQATAGARGARGFAVPSGRPRVRGGGRQRAHRRLHDPLRPQCLAPPRQGRGRRRRAATALADAGSANGVWVDERRIAEEIDRAGQRFRVGDTYLECRPQAERAPNRRPPS